MTTLRPFRATDILRFNSVNSDAWTATYHTGYYATYASTWPDFCITAEDSSGSIQAYMIAKHEPPAPNPQHHGHLTALSIRPSARGTGLARVYMDILEALSGSSDDPESEQSNGGEETEVDRTKGQRAARRDAVDACFVDLFVRCNNGRAVEMYEKMGYSVYRRVVDYYHGMEGVGSTRDELDGYDMRKSMPRDTAKRYVRDNGRDILVSPEQVWA